MLEDLISWLAMRGRNRVDSNCLRSIEEKLSAREEKWSGWRTCEDAYTQPSIARKSDVRLLR
jgi:hypothetical protein